MFRVFLLLVFLIPFQARIYKFLKPLSSSWIDPSWQLPPYFEIHADFFVTDFLILVLGGWALFRKGMRLEKYLTAFLAVALLSIVVSHFGSYLLSYWRFAHLFLASLLVYTIRSWLSPLKTIATVVVLSAVLECGIAIPQYLSQHHLGLKIVGEPTLVSRHLVASHINLPKKAVTSIDYLAIKNEEPAQIIRACGTLPHPNILGGFLVFSLLMTCYLYEVSDRKGWITAALMLQIITLFMTYSRSALFAFIGAVLLGWLLQKRVSTLWKPLLIGICSATLLLYPQLFYRGGVVSYNAEVLKSDQMRVSMQELAIQIIRDHPWLGVGFNNYLIALPEYIKGAQVESIFVHNIYLLTAAETGLIGLTLFLAFCGAALYRGWKARDSLEVRILLVLFVALLVIGAVDYYPLVYQQIRLIFFLAAGLLFSIGTRVIPIEIKPASTASLRRG